MHTSQYAMAKALMQTTNKNPVKLFTIMVHATAVELFGPNSVVTTQIRYYAGTMSVAVMSLWLMFNYIYF